MFTNLQCSIFEYIDNQLKINKLNSINIDVPNVCPNCNYAIVPINLSSVSVSTESNHIASTFFCPYCHKYFFILTQYLGKLSTFSIYPYPNYTKTFSENIEKISPNFVKIYNQAINAENNELDEICGMGYRKALEFLIKDFAIYKYPENTEDIIKCTLSNCIKKYCTNDRIKTLATACAWIGNDECHYIRKHEDYSVESLKAFINATVTFIESELSFDAATQLLQS